MEQILSKAGIAAASAAVVGATYLNGHYGISRDIDQIFADRRMFKRIEQRIKDVGPYASIYGHMLTADANAAALWFEGREWTYAQLLKGMIYFKHINVPTDKL